MPDSLRVRIKHGAHVIPDAIRRPGQQHRGMTRTTCQLKSECKNTPACTMGLRACDQGHEKDVGSIPALQHSFVMLTPRPGLLQLRIDSPEPLRQVHPQMVCSEHMELIGHFYDRKIGEKFFQKDIVPGSSTPSPGASTCPCCQRKASGCAQSS
jgi:hypothetical protein